MRTIIKKAYKGKERTIDGLKVTPYYADLEDIVTVPGSCTECSLEAKSIWMVDMKTFLCDNCLFVI